MALQFKSWSSLRLAFPNLYMRTSAGVRRCSSSSDNNELTVHEKSKSDMTEYVTPDELVRYLNDTYVVDCGTVCIRCQ